MELAIIVAEAQNHAIGRNNRLLFHLPQDMKRFKTLTTGHTVLMGRRTFESLPKGALPNRRNVVLTHNPVDGLECYDSLGKALDACKNDDKVFVIGGAKVYSDTIDKVDTIYLTRVDAVVDDADAFFPAIDKSQWEIKNSEAHLPDEKHHYSYTFIDLKRKK